MSTTMTLKLLLLLSLFNITNAQNCSWYNTNYTIHQNQRKLCKTHKIIDNSILPLNDCGWCEAIFNNVTYRKECISIATYCQNQTQCQTFDSVFDRPCGGPSGVTRAFMAILIICIALIAITRGLEQMPDCLFQHFCYSSSRAICVTICICLAMVYIITISIWYFADSSKSKIITDDILMFSMIIVALVPIELVLLIIAFRQFIEFIKMINSLAKEPVNKYVLMFLIIIIYVSIAGLFALPVYFVFTGFEFLQTVTCLSVLFLWLDLKELAFHVQTEESGALWDECDEFCERRDGCCGKNNSIDNDNDYVNIEEQKYDDAGHEEVEEHHIKLLVGELCCFSLYVTTFIVLSFVFEHLEPCFMNLATMGTVAAHVTMWVKHKKPPFYCKGIMIMVVVVMVSCTAYSCTCNENCIWAHIAVIVLVCLWTTIVASNKLCRRKKNRNNH
eukprot:161622_1